MKKEIMIIHPENAIETMTKILNIISKNKNSPKDINDEIGLHDLEKMVKFARQHENNQSNQLKYNPNVCV
ncbi:hypothetical protein [Bacillus safensis]|uniref:hypothetical protein n=1 Tax=Bacillus safensis TaxID=561879 RepID=UPI002E242928|nr:hypothetical protein [Bacillus safensis]